MKVSIKTLRQHTKEVLDSAELGQTIEVTYRGQVIAIITAPPKQNTTTKDLAFGMWKKNDDVSDPAFLKNLRKGRYRAD